MDDGTWFFIYFVSVIILVLIFVFIINHYGKEDKTKYRSNYPSSYICLDGDKVRSLSECYIDNFFHRNGIQHKYEDVIIKSQEKKYKQDWYLPEIDFNIEFFGFSGKKYHETREAKIDFYRIHNLKMISLEPSDLDMIT